MNFHRDHRTSRFLVVTALGLLLLAPNLSAGDCGNNSPAFPVEEFREGVRVWPDGLRPGNPSQRLPGKRDSTDRIGGTSVPGATSGHELYKGVDVVDDLLFVVYNAGIQVWSLSGNNAEDPQQLAFRDGWQGQFQSFPPPTEQLNFLEDISAIRSGNEYILAVSGKNPVGPSIWVWNGSWQPKYQDLGTSVRQVRLIEHNNNVFLIAAADDGVLVYDATAAANRTTACIDDAGVACGPIFLGYLPDQAISRYVDAISWNGRLFVVAGDGLNAFIDLELWELPTPSIPSTAIRRATGDSDARGPAFLPLGNELFLAYAQNGTPRVRFFDIDDCVDGNGCSGLGAVQRTELVRRGDEQFLTFSRNGSTPYLYYGVSSDNIEGSKSENLWDLTNLSAGGAIPEITDSGGTYVDPCNGQIVDYWGDYYDANNFGMRNMHPRIGVWNDGYFYRAAQTMLDVHVSTEGVVQDPETSVEVDPRAGQPPYFFGDDIDFDATAQNCAGPELWTWFSSNTDATGLGFGSERETISWDLCPQEHCPSELIDVWATKDACEDDTNFTFTEDSILLEDPRPEVTSLQVTPPGVSYPVCTQLTFTASVDGRDPFGFVWEARDSTTGDLLATSTDETFVWDTSDLEFTLPPEIFSDDFETGNLGAWLTVGAPIAPTLEHPKTTIRHLLEQRGVEELDVDISLAVTNADAGDTATALVTITSLGDLSIGSPAITAEDLGEATFELTANTSSGTEWRWIVEDPANGATTDCDGLFARCTVFDFGEVGQVLQFQWNSPNSDGQYGVFVQSRNCAVTTPVEGSIDLSVTGITDPEPPSITLFDVNFTASTGCTDPPLGGPECSVNVPIVFEVETAGNPTLLEFDWDNDGTWDVQIAAGTSATHTYSVFGLQSPKVRALKPGSAPSAAASIPGGLNIVP
ncbi:MAG: hypothetical protein AAGN46_00755 [Acidobacteriota bacterium]